MGQKEYMLLDALPLNYRQKRFFLSEILGSFSNISIDRYAYFNDISRSTAYRDLNGLEDIGLVKGRRNEKREYIYYKEPVENWGK